jgi:hypothetical protein
MKELLAKVRKATAALPVINGKHASNSVFFGTIALRLDKKEPYATAPPRPHTRLS